MRDFKTLQVWRKAHHLTLALYKATRTLPKDESYGLTSQIRRSSSSIGANIAEGGGRGGGAEFARFLHIALGSASELEYHVLLAHNLELVSQTAYERLSRDVTEIKRMLTSLIRKLRADSRGE